MVWMLDPNLAQPPSGFSVTVVQLYLAARNVDLLQHASDEITVDLLSQAVPQALCH